MNSQNTERIHDDFENVFTRYVQDLRGTENEIITFKTIAQQWFMMGAESAHRAFLDNQIDKLRELLDEVRVIAGTID